MRSFCRSARSTISWARACADSSFELDVAGRTKSIQHRKTLQIVTDAGIEESLRFAQRLPGFRRTVSFERQECVGLSHQQCQLKRLTILSRRHQRHLREAGVDIPVGLEDGGARQCEFRRREPMARRRLDQTGLCVVTGDDRRRGVDLVRELLDERAGDLGVDALPTAPEQRGVSGVLHQRVLEDVGRVRRRAASLDQLRRDELGEGVLQSAWLSRRDRLQQPIGEFPSDRRPDLRDLLDRSETIQAGHQRVLQRRGNRQWGKRAVEDIGLVLLVQQAGLQHVLGQFLDEQRHAVGLANDLFQDLRRERLAAGDAIDHREHVPAVEAAHGKRRHMRLADPGRGELRPKGDDQHCAKVRHSVDQSAENIERRGIDPVRVLQHHEDRRLLRQSHEYGEQRCNRPLLLLARRHFDCGISLRGRDRQQSGEVRRDVPGLQPGAGDHRLQLVEPRRRRTRRQQGRRHARFASKWDKRNR